MRFILVLISWNLVVGQIRITEVMYNLPGADSPNEFVELVNMSVTDTADLRGYQIRDSFTQDALVDSGYGLRLAPGQIGLILEGDYSFATGIYHALIPDSVVLMKVDDSSIGNGLSAADSLFLIDSTGATVDSVGWTDRAPPGYSLEKIRYELGNASWNWAPSRDSLGTPGRENSVVPLETDGKLMPGSDLVAPDTLLPGAVVSGTVSLVNVGRATVSGTLEIRVDSLLVTSLSVPEVAELDTITIPADFTLSGSGYHGIDVFWRVPEDGDMTNNVVTGSKGVRFPVGCVQLNEFLPVPGANQTEFVEVLSRQSLTWYGWGVSDSHQDAPGRIWTSARVDSGTLVVLGADSSLLNQVPDSILVLIPNSWRSLNNDGDELHLMDPFGTPIDSLAYSAGWDIIPATSLEKILPWLP
ncbi:MAG: lamin tail domain-containing protein, partial [Candidatus Neomarinimicrobiota bacterium]